jgi:hypothetical protein
VAEAVLLSGAEGVGEALGRALGLAREEGVAVAEEEGNGVALGAPMLAVPVGELVGGGVSVADTDGGPEAVPLPVGLALPDAVGALLRLAPAPSDAVPLLEEDTLRDCELATVAEALGVAERETAALAQLLGVALGQARAVPVPLTDPEAGTLPLLLLLGKAEALGEPVACLEALAAPDLDALALGVACCEPCAEPESDALTEAVGGVLPVAAKEAEACMEGVPPCAVALPCPRRLCEARAVAEGEAEVEREAAGGEGVWLGEGSTEPLLPLLALSSAPEGVAVPERKAEPLAAVLPLEVGEAEASADALPLATPPVPVAHAEPGVPPLLCEAAALPAGLAEVLPQEPSALPLGVPPALREALPCAVWVAGAGECEAGLLSEGWVDAVLLTSGDSLPSTELEAVAAAGVPVTLAEAAGVPVPPSPPLQLAGALVVPLAEALVPGEALPSTPVLLLLALLSAEALAVALAASGVAVAASKGVAVAPPACSEPLAMLDADAAAALAEACSCEALALRVEKVGAGEGVRPALPEAVALTLMPSAVGVAREDGDWPAVIEPAGALSVGADEAVP